MNWGRNIIEDGLSSLGLKVEAESGGWGSVFCPLHEDKAVPSLMIHMEQGGWRCLAGCGSGGDIASLMSLVTLEDVSNIRHRLRIKMVDSSDVIDRLLPKPDIDNTDHAREPMFYERGRVPKYMVNRGFTLQTLKDWEVGYDSELGAAVVPLRDTDGTMIALIRRVISGPKSRYVNTWGFDKEQYLFGLNKIPEDVSSVSITEGPLDAMWLHQCGFPAVALLGASISDAQVDLIRKRFWSVTFAFDKDDAGRKIARELGGKLRGMMLYTLDLPEGVGRDGKPIKDVQQLTEDVVRQTYQNVRMYFPI